MALADPLRRLEAMGHSAPRIAPPMPVGPSVIAEYDAAATSVGMTLIPWQRIAARYMCALAKNKHGRPRKDDVLDRWLYPEIAVVVARQNGKTELLTPRVKMGLLRGEKILHTAQNRRLPRSTFKRVAANLLAHAEFGDDLVVRKANGQEEIELPSTGGRYVIVAPTADAARGETADLVIIDEVREQTDEELMDAILPTTVGRPNAQIIYLSNAGADDSLVLNGLRERGMDGDPGIAYLEWSAREDRHLDDIDGWAEANPSLGYGFLTLASLKRFRATRPDASFETEHLCRWVKTMLPGLMPDDVFDRGRSDDLGTPRRAALGIAIDPSGTRASVAVAWLIGETIAVRITDDLIADEGLDAEKIGLDLSKAARRLTVQWTGYDPETDTELAKYLHKPEAVTGQKFAAATAAFVQAATAGRLKWEDSTGALADDIRWTARRTDPSDGTFRAVKARENRPITAVLAAIRAVYHVATSPRPKSLGVY